jgi:hypothetical protein
MSTPLYNMDEDPKEDKPFTWSDAHSVQRRMTIMTNKGVGPVSKNMGHGAECPDCSQGILEDTEASLSRDQHFKNSINRHLGGDNG